jgi:hypothetical protein
MERKRLIEDRFVYGGYNANPDRTFNDLYVLSLPGFVWSKGPSTPDLRSFHSCNVVGKRQMLVIGGVDYSLGYPGDWQETDPNAQGLSILDLTSLSWVDQYDAEAEPYQSSQEVEDWYSNAYVLSMPLCLNVY